MKKQSLLFSLSCLALGNLIFSTSATAQVTTDGTTNTTVNPDGNGNFTIEQGDRAGDNLFHSFGDFSVPTDGSAFFNNATDISNIFSRVTGGNISNIDGLIGANGTANLFLINPAGIMFGNNARLDIGGSFFGTTADSILFEDGEFNATDLNNPPLLTINAPIGLNFRDNPNGITNNSFVQNEAGEFVGLEVDTGENLTLVGGDVTFDAGEATAPGGRIEIGGLSDAGTVTLGIDNTLTFPEGVARANVTFTNAADVDVRSEGGGSILINANNIKILEGSNLLAGILEGSQVLNSRAGDIILNAQENIRIASLVDDSSTITNLVGNIQTVNFLAGITTQGNAGNIIFKSNTFEGSGNFGIASITSGAGDAGKININAIESVTLVSNETSGSGDISSLVGVSATGNGGDVTISTSSLSIVDSNLLLTTVGNGNTGDLRIEASDSITVSGDSQFQSTSIGNGDAGNIVIDAPNAKITFENPTTLVGTSIASIGVVLESRPELAELADSLGIPRFSNGSSGDITVTGQTLSLDNGASFITSTVGQATNDNLANAGNINIKVNDSFTLSGDSQLLSSTAGQGNAGDVNIIAGGAVALNSNNTGIITTVDLLSDVLAEDFNQARQGGDINIIANSVSLSDGAFLTNSTFGEGNAGQVQITATGAVELSGNSNIFNNVETGAVGDSQEIIIDAQSLSVTEGSSIQTLVRGSTDEIAAGQGNAGNINIDVREQVSFSGFSIDEEGNPLFFSQAASSLESGAVGSAGDITINADSLIISDDAFLTSTTSGQGNAGNVIVNAADTVNLLNSSSIFSQVGSTGNGVGGEITITSSRLFLIDGSQISAGVFGTGDAGNIIINASGDTTFQGISDTGLPSGILNNVNGEGDAGNIQLKTTSLNLLDGGRVTSDVFGTGSAGSITITADNDISISGFNVFNEDITRVSQVSSQTEFGVKGNAGSVEINTNSLTLSDRGFISSNANGEGNAGNINIDSNLLSISNNGGIESSNLGIGNGGNITISASDITLEDQAQILAETISQQPEGNTPSEIVLSIDNRLNLRGNSTISAQAANSADGGNITIDAEDGFVVAFPSRGIGSDIRANASGMGTGGVIDISAQQIFGLSEARGTADLENDSNDIDASSEDSTLDGDIFINTSDVNPAQRTTELPSNIVEPGQTVAQACSDRNTGVASSLMVKGRGGVPTLSNAPLSSETITVGGESETSTTDNITTIATENGSITLAKGVVRTADGQIILTPTPVTGSATRMANGSPNCG